MVVRRPGRRHRRRWLSPRQRRGFTPLRIPTRRWIPPRIRQRPVV